jgi:hypothetical protein
VEIEQDDWQRLLLGLLTVVNSIAGISGIASTQKNHPAPNNLHCFIIPAMLK